MIINHYSNRKVRRLRIVREHDNSIITFFLFIILGFLQTWQLELTLDERGFLWQGDTSMNHIFIV